MARILCVEDEPDIRADIVEELKDAGHTVADAANGADGLDHAIQFKPDLILCDFLMPVMTGPEMIQALRERHPELRGTICVVLSAYADPKHRAEAMAAGADSYLTKPIDFDELDVVMRSLLKKRKAQAQSAAQA